MDKPTERELRYEKALRHLAETAFATKDWQYARAALGPGPLPEPCRLGRGCQPNPDCQDRHQCWEPCGELGKSEEHAVPVPDPGELTPTARQALAWVLWHHQGGSSPVGQPIRFALGLGQHEHMPDWMVADAKKWDELRLHRRHDDVDRVREIRPVACTDQVRFCAHCGFGPCEKRTVTAGRFGPIEVRR